MVESNGSMRCEIYDRGSVASVVIGRVSGRPRSSALEDIECVGTAVEEPEKALGL